MPERKESEGGFSMPANMSELKGRNTEWVPKSAETGEIVSNEELLEHPETTYKHHLDHDKVELPQSKDVIHSMHAIENCEDVPTLDSYFASAVLMLSELRGAILQKLTEERIKR